jgi:hypothetical protein
MNRARHLSSKRVRAAAWPQLAGVTVSFQRENGRGARQWTFRFSPANPRRACGRQRARHYGFPGTRLRAMIGCGGTGMWQTKVIEIAFMALAAISFAALIAAAGVFVLT